MSDNDLIRRGDALYAIAGWEIPSTAIAALPAVTVGVKPPFYFDRYINGVRMAEDVCVEREATLEGAMLVAARIASKGPNGEAPVLVYRAPVTPALKRIGTGPYETAFTPSAIRDAALRDAYDRCGACGSDVTDMDGHIVHEEGCEGEQDDDPQPAPDAAAIREAAKRVTGTALHDIFVKRMSHAYVDEDPIEMKGVCMDGYFNLIQIAKDIRDLLTENPHDRA